VAPGPVKAAVPVPTEPKLPPFSPDAPKAPQAPTTPSTEKFPAPEPPAAGDAMFASASAREHFRRMEVEKAAVQAAKDEATKKAAELASELEKLKTQTVELEKFEEIRQQNEELRKHVAAASVMMDPAFRKHFGAKEKEIAANVVEYAGDELGGQLVEVLKMPKSREKTKAFETILAGSELTPVRQQIVAQCLADSDRLYAEKKAALDNAEEALKVRDKQMAQATQAKERARQEQLDSIFERTVRGAQDPQQGLEVFRADPADADRSKAAQALVESAKSIFYGQQTDEDRALAAFWAASAPKYREATVIQGKLIEQLQEELKGLRGATPGIKPSSVTEAPKPASDQPYVDQIMGILGRK
jgi:hypothetical protein